MPRRTMVAHRENLHEVVAYLRPDLRLMSRRELDTLIDLLVKARGAAEPHAKIPPIGAPGGKDIVLPGE